APAAKARALVAGAAPGSPRRRRREQRLPRLTRRGGEPSPQRTGEEREGPVGQVADVVHQLAVHPGTELGQREVEILGAWREVRGEEVAQVRRVERLQGGPDVDQRPAGLGHLL